MPQMAAPDKLPHNGGGPMDISAEEISFRPHFDTLTRSGQWEYYKSEGVDVLPCAFADLIDNSLQATCGRKNREIVVEVNLNGPQPFVYLADNGKGMSKKELAEYPVYRLGRERKMMRELSSSENRAPQGLMTPLVQDPNERAPRYLTSQIGYFGVGGKQAAFRLGKVITLMTRPLDQEATVGCLTLSEDEFERLDAAGEDPYKTKVIWRRVGDHINSVPPEYREYLETEQQYDSFTRIFISQLQPDTITYFSENFESLARTLAGIYHYYIHGPDGKRSSGGSEQGSTNQTSTPGSVKATPSGRGVAKGKGKATTNGPACSSKKDYDLQIIFRLFHGDRRLELNLADIDVDFQSKCQASEADRFNFLVEIPEQSEKSHSSSGYNGSRTIVEGFIRYHPFHLTQETIPFREEVLKRLENEQKDAQRAALGQTDTSFSSSISEDTLNASASTNSVMSTPAPGPRRGSIREPPTSASRAAYLSTPTNNNSLCLSARTVTTGDGTESVAPIDPALSNQNALMSQKPEFDLFWNGRLVPNSRVPFSVWKWTERRRANLNPEIFHRLTGCLFFDSNFGVTQNKLTFIDTSVLGNSDQIVIRPCGPDGQVKTNMTIEDEFLRWLKECSMKYDKFGVFHRREKGTHMRPDLKGPRKAWVIFKGVRMGDMDLKEGSVVKFRTTFQKMLYGKIVKFYVCADSITEEHAQEVSGYGGDAEIELHPDWIRAACKSLHPSSNLHHIYVPVGSIDFKTPYAQVCRELEDFERKLPAGLKIEYSKGTDDEDRYSHGVPSCVVRIVDTLNQVVPGRLAGNLCSVGHKALSPDLLLLRVLMRVTKAVDRPAKTARGQMTGAMETHWEERHSVEANYSEKEQGYSFNDFPLADPGKYRVSFRALSAIDEVNKTFETKCITTRDFKIRLSSATTFEIEMLAKPGEQIRLGEPIPFRVQFRDKIGQAARPPNKYTLHVEIVGASTLKIEVPEICDVVSSDCDDTFRDLQISQIVGKLQLPEDSMEKFVSNQVDLAFTIPDFCRTKALHSLHITAGVVARVEVSPLEMNIENHSFDKFMVALKDCWDNFTYQNDARIIVQHPGQEKSKTYMVKNGSCQALIATPVVVGTPMSTIKTLVEIRTSSGVFTNTIKINILPSKRPDAIKVTLSDGDGSLSNALTAENYEVASHFPPADNALKVSAGKLLKASFNILDEAKKSLNLKEIDEELLRTLRISWLAPDAYPLDLDDIREGRLPDLAAPLSTKEPMPHYISFKDGVSTIRCDFTVAILPLEPVGLAFYGLPSSLPVGAALPQSITIALVDVHGNPIAFKPVDVQKIAVTPPAKMSLQRNTGMVSLMSVQIPKCTAAGEKIHLEAKFGSFAPAQASILLVPGKPSKLVCVRPSPATINLVAGQKVTDVSFELNLVDEYSNICAVELPQVKLVCSSPDLHLTPELRPRKMVDGVAVFGPYTIAATKSGTFQLIGQATLRHGESQNNLIERINVVVSPNPDEAVHLQLGRNVPLFGKAGETIGNVPIHVLNHQRQNIKTALPNSTIIHTFLSFVPMKLFQPLASNMVEPQEVTRQMLSFKAIEQSSPGVFVVHDVHFPTVAGEWALRYQCHQMASSEEIIVKVSPADPLQLLICPSLNACLHLSNAKMPESSRILIPPTAVFEIADRFGNVVKGASANATLELSISAPTQDAPIPRIEGAQASGRKVVRADAHGRIAQVLLQDGTQCQEQVQYQLEVAVTASTTLRPFIQPFMISNDHDRCLQRNTIETEKAKLRDELNKCNALVKEGETRLHALDNQRIDAFNEKNAATEYAMRLLNNPRLEQMTEEMLNGFLRAQQDNIDHHLQKPLRLCKCRPFDPEDGVLGKIAQLALVEGEDVARVISWSIASRMDAVVTLSVDKLQEIFKRFNGNQQVVAISLMPTSQRPWDDVLPHEKVSQRGRGQPFFPEGNPIYARHCLIINRNEHEAAIKKLFQNILGDTIIIDTIDDAFSYRKYLIDRGGQAPTILTRKEAHKLDSLGFAGGGSNRAPPLTSLSYVFGAPPPKEIAELRAGIEAVERMRNARIALERIDATLRRDKEECQAKLSELYGRRKQIMEQTKELDRSLAPAQANGMPGLPPSASAQAAARKRGAPPTNGIDASPSRRPR